MVYAWLGSLLDTLGSFEGEAPSYPRYNIERVGENDYRISMAVAGFGDSDLNIEVKENTLAVKGEKLTENEDATFLHRGIASRRRPRRRQGREPRERLVARRSRARVARGQEAPHRADRGEWCEAQDDR